MARIDRYVEVLFARGGERLVVAAGAAAELEVGGASKPLTRSQLGAKLVAEMLREIAPDAAATEFEYASPHGAVRVAAVQDGTNVRIELTPAAAAAPAQPAEGATRPSDESAASTPAAAAAAPRATVAAPLADTSAIDTLFREMVAQDCSDLHLSTGSPPMVRKDGGMQPLGSTDPLVAEPLLEMLHSIAPAERRDEFASCHDSDFAYELAGVGRFRCNLFRDRHGPGAVFRVIPTEILTAEQLGLSPHILKLCELQKGLVVVTGPTGSGKSTTLAAMIDHINKTRVDHIITIEDPIEFVHQNQKCLVNQREVGTHTAGFKAALRAALREDPDIVLVGEMRDLETVEIAIETAETGHLVFGTLHTNTAASTVDRIIDQFSTDRQAQIRTMLASSLRGVIAQTLCKKKGGGRCAAQEVLIVNQAVSNLVREGKTFQIPSIMQTNRQHGMITLNDALLELVTKELVEPEEAHRKSVERAEFARALKAKGIELPADAAADEA